MDARIVLQFWLELARGLVTLSGRSWFLELVSRHPILVTYSHEATPHARALDAMAAWSRLWAPLLNRALARLSWLHSG